MSANRKLLTEIQQVLKKVEEGVLLFDDIWEKVYAAEQQALKEKYEADLKKEIKKLQRLRDQIKTWLGSSEIKDKNQLTDARKIIETKMEQFKICERDTKTKAYSREGLARESKLDPKEAEREEKRAWTNECLDRLNDIVDAVSADVEKLSSSKSKSKNKEQIEKLENKLKKNRWHIARLEQIIKLIDNEELDISKLDAIKDDVEYYIETANDDDGALGVDDEFDIYEELQLDAISLRSSEKAAAALALSEEVEEEVSVSEESTNSLVIQDTSIESDDSKLKKSIQSTSQPLKAISAVLPQSKIPPVVPKGPIKSIVAIPTPQPASKVTSSPGSTQVGKNTPTQSAPSLKTSDSGLKALPSSPLPSSSVKDNTDGIKATETVSSSSWASLAQKQVPGQSIKVVESPNLTNPGSSSTNLQTSTLLSQTIPNITSTSVAGSQSTIKTDVVDSNKSTDTEFNQDFSGQDKNLLSSSSFSQSLEPLSLQGLLPSSKATTELSMLRYSSIFSPETIDQDKNTSYVPRNPIPIHPSFPSQPITSVDNFQLIDRLPIDTLFLAFYYQQGTYQQYLAAKKLKQSSWRFHKKYLTWFQRHEEPKRTTDQFEEVTSNLKWIGTYVYFDYESGWCQRIKSEFKFEYAYLEDEVNIS